MRGRLSRQFTTSLWNKKSAGRAARDGYRAGFAKFLKLSLETVSYHISVLPPPVILVLRL